jgi:hypothetical protein
LLTYEDMTGYFLKAADGHGLVTHPEYWLNTRSMEREFACTCHTGTCDEAETHSTCNIAFTWGPLDTSLSLEGQAGVCEFFHNANEDCPHLHTNTIPPLVLDLSYNLPLNGVSMDGETLLALTQILRLHASEHSRRTIETRPGVSLTLQDNHLLPETLTLQQRVEIPIWHPLGMSGLHDDPDFALTYSYPASQEGEVTLVESHPEEWLPQVMEEVCQDILHVLAAIDASVSYHASTNYPHSSSKEDTPPIA